MSYAAFADYYDSLTQNVKYKERAGYLCRILQELHHEPGLTLDLACGTGSLTIELAGRGFDIYGVDASVEMLSAARGKAADAGLDLLFLCQKMQMLDLYGTVDTVICALDSINHLVSEQDVRETFRRVSLFMNPGGVFLFDVNTPYKHRMVLGNHTFVYDMDGVFCVWQNHFEEKSGRVGIQLDFFSREDRLYRRSSEHFYERAYPLSFLKEALCEAGLEPVSEYDDLTMCAPSEESERIFLAARKPFLDS